MADVHRVPRIVHIEFHDPGVEVLPGAVEVRDPHEVHLLTVHENRLVCRLCRFGVVSASNELIEHALVAVPTVLTALQPPREDRADEAAGKSAEWWAKMQTQTAEAKRQQAEDTQAAVIEIADFLIQLLPILD